MSLKTTFTAALVRLFVSLVIASTSAVAQTTPTISWTGANNNLWSVSANWSPARVPLNTDYVEISTGTNVVLDVNADVRGLRLGPASGSGTQSLIMDRGTTLTLATNSSTAAGTTVMFGGGSIGGAGIVTANGRISWQGGSLAGILSVGASGQLDIGGGAAKLLSSDNDARPAVITNLGLVTLTNTFCYVRYGARLVNRGAWQISESATPFYHDYGAMPVFLNEGTFANISASTVDVNSGVLFTNRATVAAQGGPIRFSGSSSFDPSSHVTGAFPVEFAGNVTVQGPIDLTTTLNMTSGYLHGAASFRSANAVMNWSGGQIFESITISNGGSLNIIGGAAKLLSSDDDTRPASLTNFGLVTWTNSAIYVRYGARIINRGTWQVADGVPFYHDYGAIPAFLNQGSFVNAGAGLADVSSSVLFTNEATVTAQNGPIRFSGAATFNSTSELNGSFLVDFAGMTTIQGSIGLNAPLAITGNIFGPAGFHGVSPVITWTGGQIYNSLTIPNSGRLNIAGGGAKLLSSDNDATPAILTNLGTVVWTNSFIYLRYSAQVINRGTWSIEDDGVPFYHDYGAVAGVLNQGTLVKAAGVNAAEIHNSIAFTNAGTITAQSAPIAFTGPAVLQPGSRLDGAFPVRLAGTITANGPIALNTLLELNGGTVDGDLSFSSAAPVINWSAGAVRHSLTIPAGGQLNLGGPSLKFLSSDDNSRPAALTNLGVIVWPVNSGPFYMRYGARVENNGLWELQADGNALYYDYGTTPSFNNRGRLRKAALDGTATLYGMRVVNDGILDVPRGKLQLPSTAVFGASSQIALTFGTSPSEYGRVEFPGAGRVHGVLSGTLGSYTPMVGDRFTVVTATSLFGSLALGALPPLPAGRAWSIQQTPNDISLTIEMAGACAPRPPGLAIWYRAESNALDAAGGFNADTNNGIQFSPGRVGSAFDFNGYSHYLSVPDPKAAHFTNVTVEGWFKFAEVGGTRVLVGKTLGGTTANSFTLFTVNGALAATINDSPTPGATLQLPDVLNANLWYHLAFTFDDAANQMALYTNGVLAASATETRSIGYDSHPLMVGADYDNERLASFFHGLADEVSIYNRALAASEIAAIYASGITGKCTNDLAPVVPPTPQCAPLLPGLIVWLPAEGNSADVMRNHHGAMMNGVGFAPGKVGQAFRFDGNDDYINLGPWFTNQTFSFAMWLKEGDSEGYYADIFDNNHTGSRSFVLQYNNSASQYVFGGGFEGVFLDLPPGVWQQLVLTREPGYITRAYLDGRLVASATNAAAIPYDGSEYLRLSAWGGGGRAWNGLLDEFQIYDRPLTSNEVQTLYTAGTSGTCVDTNSTPSCAPAGPNLVGWWTAESTQNEVASGDAATMLDGAGFAQGFVGQAFALNGNPQLISVGDLPALQGATELTLAAWVLKFPSGDYSGGVIGKWDTAEHPDKDSFLLFNGEGDFVNRGGFALQFTNGTAGLVQGATVLPQGTWVHLAATWNSSNGEMRLYKNGVLDSSTNAGLGQVLQFHNEFTAKIGEWGMNTRADSHWYGLIDEAMIFKRALAPAEISAIARAGALGACRESATNIDLATALQGRWTFDDPNDLGRDSSVHQSPLTVRGQAIGNTAGVSGGALDLDGSTGFLEGTNFPAGIPINSSAYTVSAWIKPRAMGYGGIIGWGGYGTPGAVNALRFEGDNVFRHYWWFSDLVANTAPTDLADGNWHHVATSYDGHMRRLWLDGQPIATDFPAAPGIAPANFAIGRTYVNELYAGLLDEVRVYSRALNDASMRELARGTSTDAPVPSLWLRADQGITLSNGRVATWADQSGFSHHAAAGQAPLLVTNAVNGQPAVRFGTDGNHFFNLAGSVITNQQFTIIAVANELVPQTGPREIISNGRADNAAPVFDGLTGGNPVHMRFSDDFAGVGTVVTPGAHAIYSAVNGGSSVSVYQNHTLLAQRGTPLSTRNITTPWAVGRNGTVDADYWRGDIAELLVFNRALTQDELNSVWTQLDVKYFQGGARVQPDLAIVRVSAPATGIMGETIPLVYTVTNQGNASAFGPWLTEVRAAMDSAGQGAQFIGYAGTLGELAAGRSVTVTQALILPYGISGQRYIGVALDTGNSVFESNETNNTAFAATAITINAPDLIAGNVTAPGAGLFGQTVTVTYAITNRGTAPAAASWYDYLYLGPSSNSLNGAMFLDTVAGAALAAGASYTRTQAVTLPLVTGLPPATYYLYVIADGSGSQSEADENNNAAGRAISLIYTPLPDLALTRVTAPLVAVPGTSATFSWAITNRGTAGTTGQWNEVITLSNPSLGTYALAEVRYTNSLAVGQQLVRSENIHIPESLPSGNWSVTVTADSRQDVFESDEANNAASATNTLQVVNKLTLALPAELREDASTTATISRNGDFTAPLTVTLLNGDNTELEMTNTVVLAAGQASATFDLRGHLDGIVDGPQVAGITARATGYQDATGSVTVLDVDVPHLVVTVSAPAVREGLTVPVTVSRDFATNLPLVVTLQSFDPAQLAVPATVTIPSNQLGFTFSILAVDDLLIEPTRTHSFQASAAGFSSAVGSVSVIDNDTPAVTLTLAAQQVSEGAGPQATAATIARSGDSSRDLIVEIVSSNPDLVPVPASVTFAAGASSVSFPVGVVDNTIVDGTRLVTLRVIIRDSAGNPISEAAAATLQVLDDDGPTLKVTIARDLVREGENPATTATISRNAGTNTPLAVTLTSSDTTELTVQSNLTIPAGETTATISLVSLLDGITDGNQSVTVTASAPGFTAGSDVIVVSDIDLPDYIVASATVPTNGITGGSLAVTYRIENRGIAPSVQPFTTRVLLSKDAFVGDDTVLGEFPYDGTLPVDLFIEQAAQFRLPEVTGRYWVIVIADAANQVVEALENNNVLVSAPIDVTPAYSVSVKASVTNAPLGALIPLSGSAVRQDTGLPAPGIPVTIHIIHDGNERTMSAQTDINGNFTITFTPLPGEAGFYRIGAAHPGAATAPVQDSFRIVGIRAAPSELTLKLTEQSSVTGQIELTNLSDLPLTQLQAAIVDALPAPLTITLSVGSTNIPGAGGTRVGYAVTASATVNQLRGTVRLRLSTAEGVTLDIPLNITVEPLRPRLVAYSSEIVRSLVRGRQSSIQFDLVNEGGTASGPLQVALPGLAWLNIASTNPAPSLAPGETNHVTLLATPPADAPLTDFSGSLAVNGTNSSLAVPLRLRTVSTAIADLRVIAEDEFTYFGEGAPRVTNALVKISDTITQIAITNAQVNAQGEFVLGGLPEAYYDIEVSAAKHQSFKQTVLLSADQTNVVRAFMSLQLVTYNWTVTPVQTEDRYRITLETTFEANVPAPVVTLSPSYLDLSTLDFVNGIAQVDFTLENHGLIAAQAAQLQLPLHDEFEFTTIVTNLGAIPALSSLVVPVQVKRKHGVFDRFTGPVIAAADANLVAFVPEPPTTTFPVPLDAGVLPTNTPVPGTLANGAAVLYQVVVPPGETMELIFDSAATVGTNDLYVRLDGAPTNDAFDLATTNSISPDARLVIPSTSGGTYYVLAHARHVSGTPAYTITARLLPFTITRTSTRLIDTSGLATFRVEGARFNEFTRMALIGNGMTNFPNEFRIENPASAVFSINLMGQPAGQYDLIAVQVTNVSMISTSGDDILVAEAIAAQVLLPGQIQVVQNQPGAIAALVALPDAVQFGREFPFTVVITNTGGTDVSTPLVRISGRSQMKFATETNDQENAENEQVVRIIGGIHQPTLGPGESAQLTFYGYVNPGLNAHIEVQDLSQSSGPLNWSEFEAYYRAQSSGDNWDENWAAFTQAAGPSLTSLRGALATTLLNTPAVRGAASVPADSLLFRMLTPTPVPETSAAAPLAGPPEPLVPAVTTSRMKLPQIPGMPEMCSNWRDHNYPLTLLRAAKIACRRTLQTALTGLYGAEVAGGWDIYLDYDFERNPVPPQRLQFTDGSDFVEGNDGKKNGFRQALAVKQAIIELTEKYIDGAIREKLRNCKLNCHSLPTSMTLEEVFEGTDKKDKAYAAFDKALDFHSEPSGIPSNTAGGRSGSFRGTKDEGRLLKGSRILLRTNRSSCGNLQGLEIETDLRIQYDDSLDFCPGGIADCGFEENKLRNDSWYELFRTAVQELPRGACLPRSASYSLQILESYELAYSVPFTVTFKPDKYVFLDKLSKYCPQRCCPAKVGVNYAYECGGNAVAKNAQAVMTNGKCQSGSEGLPDCQTIGKGFDGLNPFSGSPDAGAGAGSSGSSAGYSTDAACSPGGAKIAGSRAPKTAGEVCAKVKLQISQDLVTTRDAFKASLEIVNSTATSLDAIEVNLVVRDENGDDATELFGVRAPELDGLSGVTGNGSVAGNMTGKASWVLIPTIDAATNGPTTYYVSGSFAYTLNGVRVTVPLAPAPITALPSASLVLKYFHQRDVFSDDPYTPQIEPSVPFSLAVMIQNSGKGAANNLHITSAQPKIIDNEKGLLIDFQIIGTEVAGQAQSPSLTATFGTILPDEIAIGRWLLTSTLQGLFIDYTAKFEHLDAIGNKRLSIIDHVEIHEMNHLVQAGGAFEDGRPDFLVNDVPDPDDLPDTLYLSDGRTNSVFVVTTATHDGPPSSADLAVQLTALMPGGWTYLRVPDPANGAFRLVRVVRSDNVEIALGTNVWVTDRTFIGQGRRPISENRLHLLDFNSTGSYTLYYAPLPTVDLDAPSSTVAALPTNSYSQFAVQWSGTDNGGSGISFYDIYVSIDGGAYAPWLQRTPFTSSIYPGTNGHTYAFYSVAVDASGNREAAPLSPDAQTRTGLSNTRPTLTVASSITINEGDTLSLTAVAADADQGQTLAFSLLPGAPAGVVLNPSSGQLAWATGEGNGPSTNRISIVVSDNGQPSLSATSVVTVVVNEVNTAPRLAAIASRVVNELQNVSIALLATDADLPAQRLTFSFASPPPQGVTLDAATGVFSWTPSSTQGPSTNRIQVAVRDNGTPSLSATQTFTITVRDSRADFVVGFGATNLLAGQSGRVPVTLLSGLGLTNVALTLNLSANGLTNLALSPAAAAVGSANLSPNGANQYRMRLAAALGDVLDGAGEFAQLSFATSTNNPSSIVYLAPAEVSGVRSTGEGVPAGGGTQGRVVIVNQEPVLIADASSQRSFTLFGRPGRSIAIERSTNLLGGDWSLVQRIPHTNLSQTVVVGGGEGLVFYRASDFVANPPLFEVPRAGEPLLFYARPGLSYRLESSATMGASAIWTPVQAFTLSNSFQWHMPTNSPLNRYYRVVQQ